MNKSTQTQIELLNAKFGKFYNEVKDNYSDDRRLFQNIFEQLLEALEVMKTIENITIRVAFNAKFNEEMETLERIMNKF